ncbi:MAG: MBL fold metallo-hydrolase [Acidimicrobiales bacterium]
MTTASTAGTGPPAGPRPLRQEQEPPSEEVAEVAPGVLRVQLPVTMPGLGHVNAYVIPDARGAAIVDPGLPGEEPWGALRRGLRRAGVRLATVHTVVVTHSHPDHFGGAGRLSEESGATVVVHGSFRTWWDPSLSPPHEEVPDVDPQDLEDGNPFELPSPWGGEDFAGSWRARPESGEAGGWVPFRPGRRVADGDRIDLAGRQWTCVHTPGHTIDHLCLHDPEEGVLLCGDHVLPTITPHVPGLGAGRDPLAAFTASLERVRSLRPVGLALPAHGHPFEDLAGRAAAIESHHVERLARMDQAVADLGSATVAEVSHRLFRPERWGVMAESETYAHLEHLRHAGRLARVDAAGPARYEVTGS